MSEEPEFTDFNDELHSVLADPDTRQRVDAVRAEMREADRAYAMGLAALRQAASLTQDELAAALGVTQGAVAQTEKRRDLLLSTLNSYVQAIGGHVDIVVTFDNGQQVTLDLKEAAPEPPAAAA